MPRLDLVWPASYRNAKQVERFGRKEGGVNMVRGGDARACCPAGWVEVGLGGVGMVIDSPTQRGGARPPVSARHLIVDAARQLTSTHHIARANLTLSILISC